ncbi:MAG TPA: methyltransferase domain-containing protein [Gemmatimonadales bacterium]
MLRRVEQRSPALVREHYEIERELADRLRSATREERRSLYGVVYDELYQRVPHHPQLRRKSSAELTRRSLGPQLRILRRYLRPDTTVLEIGPGDCSLSMALAERVRQVYGLDVSEKITQRASLPSNFKLILSDGTSVPLPPDSVDVAYSNQLMEHLHPDDALEQLEGIYRALRPGGVYICITPNRLDGPHDVSQYFDSVATGFHLKEYTVGELSRLFRQVGFRKVHALIGGRGVCLPAPVGPVSVAEAMLQALPPRPRRALGRTAGRAFLGIRLLGTK